MKLIKVRTRKFLPPKDNIYKLLQESLPSLKEGDILLITSKVVAIHQGRSIKITPKTNKDKLSIKEADWYIERKRVPGGMSMLTIKDHTLLSSAGIDSSNGNGYYILAPKKPHEEAKLIYGFLKRKH